MSSWRTLLLVRDRDEALLNWARRASLLEQHEFIARPRASLERENDAAVLKTDNKRTLFSYLGRAASPPKTLHVFVTAPRQDLSFFNGREFFYESTVYRLLSVDQRESAAPYSHRLFRVEYRGTDVQRDQDTGRAEVREGAVSDQWPIFFDPLPIELTQHQADDLVQGLEPGEPYSEIRGACFLPPVRTRHHPEVVNSYFGDDPTRLRRVLRAAADLVDARVDEPSSLHLVRLTDHPTLRDFLLDGAGLPLVRGDGMPTSVCLQLGSGGGLPGKIRVRLVLDGVLNGPSWAHAVASALRQDVTELVTGVVGVREGESSTWGLAEEPSPNPVAHEGTWQVLHRHIVPQLKTDSVAEYFRTQILDPSCVYHEKKFDHYFAASLFITHAWRCPWHATPDEGYAWRRSMLDLLQDELVGRSVTAAERLLRWNSEVRDGGAAASAFAGVSQPPTLRVTYSGDPDDNDMLFRRLLLPMGTILSGRTIYLDKGARSRLDAGLVLA